ncbi:MAG: hypothetical protein C0483_16425 [Pirellula sp.]|nr:hypothetical protein [Pirellula sp.]
MLGMMPMAPCPAFAGLAALDAFHVGRYHLANGQREQALESFNDALRLNPQFVQAYVARGKLYAELGQHESALVDLNFALRLQPTHAEAFAYRGYALLSLGQAQKALPDLEMALRIDPSYARVHFLRGQAMQMLGDEQAAGVSIAMARRLDPTLDVSQVITASADGSLADVGVQLAGGGSGPQRTPVMSELMPVQLESKPFEPRSLGRLVPFQQHPNLADVAPPAMSRGSVLAPALAHANIREQLIPRKHAANRPRPLTPPQTASAAPKLPDITSKVPLDASHEPLDLELSAKPISKVPNEISADAKVADAKQTDKVALEPKAKLQDEIALSMPDVSKPAPAVTVKAIPQTEATEKLPAPLPTKTTEAPVAKTEPKTEPAEESAIASSERKDRHIPAFGPQIFVVPADGAAADSRQAAEELAANLPASAILRGAPTGGLMLPEKPSSIESDRRLQAAVEAARLSAASDDAMAIVEDTGDVEEPAVAQNEPTAEQLEQSKAAYRRGTQLEAEGKTAEALAAYQEAVKLNPNDAEAYCRRGHLLMEGLRTAEALAAFEKVIAVAPGLSSGYFGRAHVRYVTEQYLEAVYDYSIALRFDDQHAQAFIERGHCYDLLGRVAEAKADRRAALDLDPSLAKTGPKYAMGTKADAIPTAVMPGATAFAGDIESVVPTTASDTSSKLGNQAIATDVGANKEVHQPKPGESAFENLFNNAKPPVADAPEGVSTSPDAATKISPNAKESAAEAELKRLSAEISEFPGDKDRYFRRARAYCTLGQLQAALDDLNTCLRFDAAHLEAIKLRAEVHAKLHNSAAAAADLTTALQQSPDDVTLLLNRATSLAENGDVRAALADLDRAVALDPRNRAAYLERSRIHAERGAFTEAQADRDQAVRLGSESK